MKAETSIYILAGVVLACLILRYWKDFTDWFKNTLAWEIISFIPELFSEIFRRTKNECQRIRREYQLRRYYLHHKYEAPQPIHRTEDMILSTQEGYEEFKEYINPNYKRVTRNHHH